MGERGIVGGAQAREQAVGEQLTWTLNVYKVGSIDGAVTNPDMTVTRLAGLDSEDVTADVTSGAMAVAGQIITLLAIGGVVGGVPASLTEGTQYRVDVTYDKDGQVDLKNEFTLTCPDVRP